jgi:hypothetical protein
MLLSDNVRRVVTVVDDDGKAVVLFDGPLRRPQCAHRGPRQSQRGLAPPLGNKNGVRVNSAARFGYDGWLYRKLEKWVRVTLAARFGYDGWL